MDNTILASLITEGSKFLSEWLRLNQNNKALTVSETRTEAIKITPQVIPPVNTEKKPPVTSGKESVATGCVPCALGHIGTCTGVLNESVRFARKDGLGSPEVIQRVNMCLDELNAMERVDLRPEKIVELVPWEKELAEKSLEASRQMRHELESLSSLDDLEQTAANTQKTRQQIGLDWYKHKLENLTPEEKDRIQRRVMERLKSQGSDSGRA